MWWSERWCRAGAPCCSAWPAALGACNFRPIYLAPGADNAATQSDLAAIEVQGLGGRLGYLLRDALLDELNPPASRCRRATFSPCSLSSRADALGDPARQHDHPLQPRAGRAHSSCATRPTSDVLYSSTVQRISSYNVRREPFADLTAAQDAERRAAHEVATEIRTLLALQFARTPAAT